MRTLEQRLNAIEARISDASFLKNKGLGNEVGYYVFDYPPEYELEVRSHIEHLRKKMAKQTGAPNIVEFDLYEIIIDLLESHGYLNMAIDMEANKGFFYAADAIIKALRLTDGANEIVRHIVDNTPAQSVVFITGVGKCFPLARSHNVLNNLHQVMDNVPVVMFFPGEYSGQELRLFGTLKDDNYYRAFKLV